jgi:hypothetical protein
MIQVGIVACRYDKRSEIGQPNLLILSYGQAPIPIYPPTTNTSNAMSRMLTHRFCVKQTLSCGQHMTVAKTHECVCVCVCSIRHKGFALPLSIYMDGARALHKLITPWLKFDIRQHFILHSAQHMLHLPQHRYLPSQL